MKKTKFAKRMVALSYLLSQIESGKKRKGALVVPLEAVDKKRIGE